MHRIRQSISFYPQFGFEPTVIAVDPVFVETGKDDLLTLTLPNKIAIYWIKAFSTNWTRKLGLGALALRSLWYFFCQGNQLLKSKKFDLIYFSTTQFPVLVLGRYWQWRYTVPYIIDMQDPWHSEYYVDKPKSERPPKYWFSYRLNKFLEPIAMKGVLGIISVSEGYCTLLQSRYPNISKQNCCVIPFGAFEKDFQILNSIDQSTKAITINSALDTINCTYIGRGGHDMHLSLRLIFKAFTIGLQEKPSVFSKVRLNFIGTSYAPGTTGKKTIAPVAEAYSLTEFVNEQPARIPYFESLRLLQQADMLLIPGSDDPNYTASKLYPYVLAKRPLLAVFSNTSSVISILEATNAGKYVAFNPLDLLEIEEMPQIIYKKWADILQSMPFTPATNWDAFLPYSAQEMSRKQADFFNLLLGTKVK